MSRGIHRSKGHREKKKASLQIGEKKDVHSKRRNFLQKTVKGETCVCCDCEGFHPCTASSGAKETPIQPKPMAGHGPGGCASVQGRRARPRRADDLYASAPRIRPRSLISLTSPGDVSVSRRRQPRGAEPGRPSTRLGRAPAPDPRGADELPARAENHGRFTDHMSLRSRCARGAC